MKVKRNVTLGICVIGRQAVEYRGRVGTVLSHDALTQIVAKSIAIRFPDGDEAVVSSFLWPWVKVLDEGQRDQRAAQSSTLDSRVDQGQGRLAPRTANLRHMRSASVRAAELLVADACCFHTRPIMR